MIAASVLGGMGVYGDLGVGIQTGSEETVEDIEESESVQEPASESDEGYLGMASSGLSLLTDIATWPANLPGILANIGVPGEIAGAFGLVAVLIMAITMAKFARGIS
ncbi:hypothetical protein AArcMg_0691 [Natrarchaeobaculum sulfurireducens]|uniref:Uncharacterized protein n=1 Tax=Natrarchaeobaculum sulfurireducens TaxID=2044521 RepID=A0A346PMG8_9EURY|nr:hypothetical protein AArcMg_0691 [Natrarchaeobaculum sulfurireducens]